MDKELLKKLTRCHLFDGIALPELHKLLDQQSCRLRTYHEGAVVTFRGDAYEDLWIVLEGSLSAQLLDYQGKILKVETLSAVEPIATAILFAPERVLPVTLTAETHTSLCLIPRRMILRMMQANERFLLNYLEDSGLRLTVLAEKLRLIQFSTIREKIASYLLDLADKQSTESPSVPVSKETLAEIFGVSRPSLSREFSHLVEEGIISQEGRQINIMNRKELEEILEFC